MIFNVDLFWSKVDRSGGRNACHLWKASLNRKGYGQFRIRQPRTMREAHKIAYELTKGPVSNGLQVCHKCDVRHCCNPEHLWLGTPYQNTNDMVTKDRHCRGSRSKQAKLTENDVRQIELLRSTTDLTLKEIGRRYGVHEVTVHDALNRRTWRHVTG